MKPFTVVFSHDLPLQEGVGQYLCVLNTAETAEDAANQCIRSVGGYATIIVVLEGHHTPVLRGNCPVNVFDDSVKYKTKEVFVPFFYRKSPNPASFTPKNQKKIKKKHKNGDKNV